LNYSSLYKQLEIPDFSDISLVKKSFRQLALQYHPDRNTDPSAAEKFSIIRQAYEVLNNHELKSMYDARLKQGFEHFAIPNFTPENDFEAKRRSYAKMKKEKDEMAEVNNINTYEKSLINMPFIWRIGLLGMLYLTGIISIVSDWYVRGNKIAIGLLLLVGSSIFLWNEFYKYYWHKSLTLEEKRYDRQAMRIFFGFMLIGLSFTFSLIKIKKAWHLHHFSKVIYAGINHDYSTLSYTYNNYLHVIEIYEIPEKLYFKDKVLIKISTKEPEIWEYLEDE
jgi:hypothetical protein